MMMYVFDFDVVDFVSLVLNSEINNKSFRAPWNTWFFLMRAAAFQPRTETRKPDSPTCCPSPLFAGRVARSRDPTRKANQQQRTPPI